MKDSILWHPNEHRLVYDVFDDTVRVLSCKGHYKKAIYSRKITDEHRLVYDVFDDTVRVLSCEGHYKDKNFDEY